MFFRLRCHYCGKRSRYSKGTTEFQCEGCDVFNFYDKTGEVVDTPTIIADPPNYQTTHTAPFQTFTRKVSSEAPKQQNDIFCQRCRGNQQIYMETLSNYLPGEDHPNYQEFEDRLPEFKANLEKKYPQICQKCAKGVQMKLHETDYYGSAQNIAVNTRRTRGGQRKIVSRDDWSKWTKRSLLSLIGTIVYTSLLAQAMWHLYGIFTAFTTSSTTDDSEATIFALDTTFTDCVQQSRLLRFNTSCYQIFSALIPKVLIASFCLLWHNPGLKAWYHGTHRFAAVKGQTEYFRIQVLLLLIRVIAWYNLSDPVVISDLQNQQKVAAHGFMIVFMTLSQWISERTISTEKWELKGRVTPKPDYEDLFTATAGPAEEPYARKASSRHPLQLFPRNEKPFPIENLAPKPRRGYRTIDIPAIPPPSPPDSGSPSDVDMVDDWQPEPPLRSLVPGAPIDRTFRQKNYEARRPQTRSTYNYGSTQPLGWGAMRNELFDIQDKGRAEQERKREEEEERAKLRYQPPVRTSPFHGRLPPAPKSMEHKLRNPTTQLQFKKAPASKQQDFMKQMRESFEHGRSFSKPKAVKEDAHLKGSSSFDFDEDFSPIKGRTRSIVDDGDLPSPAKTRTKGSLDLRQSTWTLASDMATATGLEDLMGQALRIQDGPGAKNAPIQQSSIALPPVWMFVAGIMVAVVAFGWNVQPVRRAVCLWLVRQIEQLGY